MTTKKISARDRLNRDLTTNYNVNVEPGSIELTIGLSLVAASRDDATKGLNIAVWEYHAWKDSRLTWNPNDYDGVNVLRIPQRQVWIPDTRVYNSITPLGDRDTDINVVVKSDGTVFWVPRSNYRIPAKEQGNGELKSSVKFGSWTYRESEISLKWLSAEGFNVEYLSEYSPYTVVSSTAKVSAIIFDGEPYPLGQIDFVVKPRA